MSDSYEFKVKVNFEKVECFSASLSNWIKIILKDHESMWFYLGSVSHTEFVSAFNEWREAHGKKPMIEEYFGYFLYRND